MKKKQKEIFWGIAFVVIALAILAIAFGWITTETSRYLWSLLLGVVALASLVKLNWFPFFLMVAIIVHVNMTAIGLVSIWPVYLASFLGAIGLSILTSSIKKRNRRHFTVNINGKDIDIDTSKFKSKHESHSTVSGEHIMIENNFNESARYVNSTNLQTANIENNFGSLRVYFDETQFSSEGAKVRVENNFGKTSLYFPKNVRINNQLSSSFGHVDDDLRYQQDSEHPIVTVSGDSSFGNVEIITI